MDFRLNKIDPEIRRMVNQTAKEGKIHESKRINKTDKDKKNKDKRNKNKKEENNNRDSFSKSLDEANGRKIQINAFKTNNVEVEAFKEGKFQNNSLKGRFLDIKK